MLSFCGWRRVCFYLRLPRGGLVRTVTRCSAGALYCSCGGGNALRLAARRPRPPLDRWRRCCSGSAGTLGVPVGGLGVRVAPVCARACVGGLEICSVQHALEGWSRHGGVLALTASACNRLGSPHSGTCPRAPRSLGISRTWDMPRSDGRRCLGALSKTPCSHSPLLASACRGAPVRCAPAGQPVLQDWPPLASQLTIGAPRCNSAAWLLVSFTQPHCWLWACGG